MIAKKKQNLECILPQNKEHEICKILENCINQLKVVQCLNEKKGDDKNKTFNTILKSLQVINEELKSYGTFNLLKEIVNYERSRYEEELTLQSDLEKCENEILQLDNRYKTEQIRLQTELENKNRIIFEQNDELQRLKTENDFNFEFMKQCQEAEIEENKLRCELEEKELNENISKLNNDIVEEQVAHRDILWYYENEAKKINQLISHWQTRYKDIDEREEELKMLKKTQINQHNNLNYYKTMYLTRKKEIEEYLADKERRQKEYEYEQYRNKMAIRIQAWWRGIMVRRYLGPFKYLLKLKNIKKRKQSIKKNVIKK